MSFITFKNVSFQYEGAERLVFSELNLLIKPRSIVGIIGNNGSGKTTLLGLISGKLHPTIGDVFTPFDGLSIGENARLESSLFFSEEERNLYEEMCRVEHLDPVAFGNLVVEFSATNGFEKLAVLEKELQKLGLQSSVLDEPKKLSEGWKKFISLLCSLLSNAPFILWDEPTNFLDIEKRALIVDAIRRTKSTLIFTSHDRHLLSLSTQILELERGKLLTWSGDYKTYLAEKEYALTQKHRQREKLDKQISSFGKQARNYQVWGAKKEKEKRGAPNKGAISARAARLEKRGIQAKKRMTNSIAILEGVKPYIEHVYRFDILDASFSSGSCFSCNELPIYAGGVDSEREIFRASIQLFAHDRVGLVGQNGAGKSSLMRTIYESSRWKKGCEVVWVSQFCTRVGTIADGFRINQHQDAKNILGAFDIDGVRFNTPLDKLSDGQFQKVRLVQAILHKPDVLLLDEPTHHLDLRRIQMLEEALNRWNGTLLVISHDEDFVASVTNQTLYIEDFYQN